MSRRSDTRAAYLLKLEPEKCRSLLERMDERQRHALRHHWRLWAHDGEIAARQGGQWLFIAPRDGMRLLDRSTGQQMLFRSGWQAPAAPVQPTGGSTIDAEMRAAFANLLSALTSAGIISAV